MTRPIELTADTPGERLDRFVALRRRELSRSRVQRLIAGGLVTVDGAPAKPSLKLRAGQAVSVTVLELASGDLVPQDIPLKVVYQDTDILVIDKPAGLVVHPGPGHPDRTLANAVLALCPGLVPGGDPTRAGIAHRLDKDTSGLMVVARNEAAHAHVAAQFKERTVRKGYLALVHGRPRQPEGLIEAPIGRDPRNRKRMAVVAGGRYAATRYRAAEYLEAFTLLEVAPSTGRTHQVRVHMAHIGHPLAGDATYGRGHPLIGRHFLHAHRLGFRLPSSGEHREFSSELPPELAGFLHALRGEVQRGEALCRETESLP